MGLPEVKLFFYPGHDSKKGSDLFGNPRLQQIFFYADKVPTYLYSAGTLTPHTITPHFFTTRVHLPRMPLLIHVIVRKQRLFCFVTTTCTAQMTDDMKKEAGGERNHEEREVRGTGLIILGVGCRAGVVFV